MFPLFFLLVELVLLSYEMRNFSQSLSVSAVSSSLSSVSTQNISRMKYQLGLWNSMKSPILLPSWVPHYIPSFLMEQTCFIISARSDKYLVSHLWLISSIFSESRRWADTVGVQWGRVKQLRKFLNRNWVIFDRHYMYWIEYCIINKIERMAFSPHLQRGVHVGGHPHDHHHGYEEG